MDNYRETLDEIFVSRLGYEFLGSVLPIPAIDGSENLLSLSREYSANGVDVIVAECNDRILEFHKKLIQHYKRQFPDSHFLFISNHGSVFDLYNVSSSPRLKKITYNEIDRNTRLFKEKIQLFNVEEAKGTVDLKIKIDKAFDTSDKITKKFYNQFQTIHRKLTGSISGISDKADQSWYASVLMNRIMFIYFLQKHGAIQNDYNFLLTKFDQVEKSGKDFYRDFLLPLFLYGFAKRDNNPLKQQFVREFGPVKYLNGGLFYPHSIEKKYTPSPASQNVKKSYDAPEWIIEKTKIIVNAKTLKEILQFLKGYTWYLDSRPMREDTDINPDVLGYIFEKYINQKELGAYYTKEDITGYISKNTIIPFILDKLRRTGFKAPDPTPMITNNEDIIANMADYLEQMQDYETLKFLYKEVLLPLSVLDPAVGSGAFLFAALNILLPIYRKVVFKLRTFREQKRGDAWLQHLLSTLDNHSEEYYLTKQIILNNLYGVDIVEEATEICKLRLFLQLASHLPNIKEIEPLPDIDFNIYSGNSLVGGLSWEDLEKNYTMDLFSYLNKDNIKKDIEKLTKLKAEYKRLISEQIRQLADLKERYRQAQQAEATEDELNHLKNQIAFLENEVNRNINIGIGNPFHWFIEFNQIMEKGGFDVIIGNPPYVEYSEVKKEYQIRGYRTLPSGNLYAYFIERASRIKQEVGSFGMIVPVASVCTGKLESLQNLLVSSFSLLIISSFNDRPGKLFDGLEHIRLAIIIGVGSKHKGVFSTKYNRWFSKDRDRLFNELSYVQIDNNCSIPPFPKVGSEIANQILQKIKNENTIEKQFCRTGRYKIFYTRKLSGFVQILDFVPLIFDMQGNERKPSELKELSFESEGVRDVILAALNSSLFYWFLTVYSDCRNLNKREILSFPFDYSRLSSINEQKLMQLSKELMTEIKEHSEMREMSFKDAGKLTVQCTFPKYSKEIIDEIDRVLANHYNFSEQEKNYIIGYDLIFRIGEDE